jgi:hypothetical protein
MIQSTAPSAFIFSSAVAFSFCQPEHGADNNHLNAQWKIEVDLPFSYSLFLDTVSLKCSRSSSANYS